MPLGNGFIRVLPSGIPLPFAISQQIYNLREVRCFNKSFEYRSIIPFLKIECLIYLLSAERYPSPSDINCLVLSSHHVSVELFNHIYEPRSLVLTKKMSSFAFYQLLEGGFPLVKTSFPNEVSMLHFISPSNISHVRYPVTNLLFANLCFFISSFSLSQFFHYLLRIFIFIIPLLSLLSHCLSSLNHLIFQLHIFLHDFV